MAKEFYKMDDGISLPNEVKVQSILYNKCELLKFLLFPKCRRILEFSGKNIFIGFTLPQTMIREHYQGWCIGRSAPSPVARRDHNSKWRGDINNHYQNPFARESIIVAETMRARQVKYQRYTLKTIFNEQCLLKRCFASTLASTVLFAYCRVNRFYLIWESWCWVKLIGYVK